MCGNSLSSCDSKRTSSRGEAADRCSMPSADRNAAGHRPESRGGKRHSRTHSDTVTPDHPTTQSLHENGRRSSTLMSGARSFVWRSARRDNTRCGDTTARLFVPVVTAAGLRRRRGGVIRLLVHRTPVTIDRWRPLRTGYETEPRTRRSDMPQAFRGSTPNVLILVDGRGGLELASRQFVAAGRVRQSTCGGLVATCRQSGQLPAQQFIPAPRVRSRLRDRLRAPPPSRPETHHRGREDDQTDDRYQ